MLVGRSGWYARSLAGHASKTRCTRFDGGIGLAASGRFNRPLQAQSIHRLARDMANQAQPQRKSLFGHSGIGLTRTVGPRRRPDFLRISPAFFPRRALRPSFPQHAFRPSRFELQTAAKSRPATAQTHVSGLSCPFSTQSGGKTDAENPQVNP